VGKRAVLNFGVLRFWPCRLFLREYVTPAPDIVRPRGYCTFLMSRNDPPCVAFVDLNIVRFRQEALPLPLTKSGYITL
jgi:hypothetical protein